MRPLIARLLLTATLLVASNAAVRSQEPPAGPPQGPPLGGRDSLETMVRQRMAQVLRTQLSLTDEQMRRLAATNRRFERQRVALVAQERDVRLGLRDELESGDTTRSTQIAGLLDRMLAVQRQRIDLMEAEQKELATFLTPIQRARYFGMEEQIRRRVMEMREQEMQRGPQGMRRPGAQPQRPPGAQPPRAGAPPGGRRPPRGAR